MANGIHHPLRKDSETVTDTLHKIHNREFPWERSDSSGVLNFHLPPVMDVFYIARMQGRVAASLDLQMSTKHWVQLVSFA